MRTAQCSGFCGRPAFLPPKQRRPLPNGAAKRHVPTGSTCGVRPSAGGVPISHARLWTADAAVVRAAQEWSGVGLPRPAGVRAARAAEERSVAPAEPREPDGSCQTILNAAVSGVWQLGFVNGDYSSGKVDSEIQAGSFPGRRAPLR